MKKKSEIGKGMGAWSKGLEGTSAELARSLARPREEGWKLLEEIDLPRYERIKISAESFLADPTSATEAIPSKELFVFLQPKDGTPVRKTKLNFDEAVAFVRETVSEHPEAWEVHISETRDEVYGGNIFVRKDGRAVIEMTTQGQGGVSAGTITPEMRAWQDRFTGVWKYSVDDQVVKAAIQQVMKEVPHEEREYLPGLYEFHLVQEEEDGPLEVKFIDFRPE